MLVPRLILASGSPRRRELLTSAGFQFEIDVPDLDETIHDGEPAVAATSRLAIEKAQAVASRRCHSEPAAVGRGGAAGKPREIVLAADTTVVIEGRILGKPATTQEAVEMLLSLAGRNHVVLTAWAVLTVDRSVVETDAGVATPECGISRSIVRMREIARAEAEAYAASGEPMDKAGAYAAQGEGRRFIGGIVGPLDNVIGLPMRPVVRALARTAVVPASTTIVPA